MFFLAAALWFIWRYPQCRSIDIFCPVWKTINLILKFKFYKLNDQRLFSGSEIQKLNQPNRIWILAPLFGNILFVIFYIIAAVLYPGDSNVNRFSTGYSWSENYWCNLLNDTAINGQINTAKPIAVVAMVILCISLSSFWILFPLLTQLKTNLRYLIQLPGILSMITAFLLLTNVDHDIAVNTASFFGAIAMAGTIWALYKMGWRNLFFLGLGNAFLIGLNNFLYHTAQMTYLPLVQKFTFLSFLFWFSAVIIRISKV